MISRQVSKTARITTWNIRAAIDYFFGNLPEMKFRYTSETLIKTLAFNQLARIVENNDKRYRKLKSNVGGLT